MFRKLGKMRARERVVRGGIKLRGRVLLRAAALFFLTQLFLPRACWALDPARSIGQYVHTAWGQEAGLPAAADISTILQTQNGYIWLATQSGLVRFNGSEFTVYNSANTPALKYNRVEVLYEDREQNLWIATGDGVVHGSLVRYRDGRFERLTNKDGPTDTSISAITSDKAGNLWIATVGHGIYRYRDGQFKPYTIPGGFRYVFSLYVDHHGIVLASTTRGLFRLEGDAFVPDRRINPFLAPNVQVVRVAESSQGELAVATYGGGLLIVPSGEANSGPPLRFLASGVLHEIFYDKNDNLWVAGGPGGYYRWKAGRFVRLRGKSDIPPKAEVSAFYQDRGGSLWIGTGLGGLCRLANPEAGGPAECYSEQGGLHSDSVMAVYEDREGSLWVATSGPSLERFSNGALTVYRGHAQGLPGSVEAMFQARDQSLWIGTESGLVQFLKNEQSKGHTAPFGPTNNAIRAIAQDQAGNIWTGTEYGLNRFSKSGIETYKVGGITAIHTDRAGGIWYAGGNRGATHLSHGKKETVLNEPTAHAMVSAIFVDHAGTLWLGTAVGVTRLQNGKRTDFPIQESERGSDGTLYYSMGVSQIYEDGENVLWIGTNHSGLWRLKNDRLSAFTDADGLLDKSIFGVAEDDRGFLWMTSSHGIFKCRKSELNDFAERRIPAVKSISYDASGRVSGAGCSTFGQNHALKTSDGKLLFACFQGFASVDPAKLPFNSQMPPLAIEQVSLNGRRIAAADTHVPVNRGEAEIHYAALSYLAPERVDYKYQLEGYDKDWVSAGTRRVAYYTNLPPGPYRFRVIACNNDGVWNEQGATFGFYLEPRFYQTRWFALLSVLAVICLVAGIYRMRIRQARKREQELAALVAERTAELQQQSRELQEQSEALHQEVIWRKLAQEAAQLAKEVAESATRSKGEFLANMSHEIRTPLNGVLGMLELATHTSPTPEQAELLTIARDSATSLLVVLNDILDFSKIEAGKLAFESIPFNLSDTVTEAARSVAIRAHEKGLELACEVAPDVPMMVRGDSSRLKQVLLNLLGNAIKFTSHGEIFLRVERELSEPVDARQAKLKFSVSDTGIGIPKDKQRLIFEAFTQEDTSTTRKFGGTGLGLTICSRIVNLMGGEIWVESEPGAGSTFRFTARLPIAESKAPDPAVLMELTGVRVLIVDDNATNRRILEGMLAGYGLIVGCAESGKAGLEAIRQAADAGTPFRLALVDYQMPGMDGFQFVELAAELMAPSPSMMMLTSDDYNVTSQRCREMELPGYLIKPIKQSELIAAVRAALRPEAPKHTGEALHAPEEGAPKLTILLAEDNVVNQKVAIRMLERAGHTVLLANNGREALEKLDRQDFDLVLMDIQMPEVDGLEASAAIRQREVRTGEHVPIVAMTAHAMSGDRERILAAGMDDYVSKPIDIKHLLETIRRVTENRRVTPVSK